MKAALYRIGQGLRALSAFATAPDLALAAQHLTNCELKAFCALSRSEQLHSLNVLRALLNADATAPSALRAAALLHDAGKARARLNVWQKTCAVILTALAPMLSHALSEGEALTWWRAPFIVRRHHATWGAEILRACQSDAAVIWLVEHHQDNASDHRGHPLALQLIALQRADNAQ